MSGLVTFKPALIVQRLTLTWRCGFLGSMLIRIPPFHYAEVSEMAVIVGTYISEGSDRSNKTASGLVGWHRAPIDHI
jgi:hypothetical protein